MSGGATGGAGFLGAAFLGAAFLTAAFFGAAFFGAAFFGAAFFGAALWAAFFGAFLTAAFFGAAFFGAAFFAAFLTIFFAAFFAGFFLVAIIDLPRICVLRCAGQFILSQPLQKRASLFAFCAVIATKRRASRPDFFRSATTCAARNPKGTARGSICVRACCRIASYAFQGISQTPSPLVSIARPESFSLSSGWLS